MPESDLEMMAMLSRAAERVGLEWRKPPCPEPSRLDDWFLKLACAGSQRPEYVQEQDGSSTETVSEAPGAYGSCGGSHAAGAALYVTASTLAPWPSPEVGVAAPARSGSESLRPAAKPLPRGQTFRFFGQKCP